MEVASYVLPLVAPCFVLLDAGFDQLTLRDKLSNDYTENSHMT